MSREEKFRQEQIRRLHRLLDKHVRADDVELTDTELVVAATERFQRKRKKT